MLNEFVYCPRLGYLEWAQGEFADNADVVEGRVAHRRVDQQKGALAEPDANAESTWIHARSVWLSAPVEGLTARADLLEGEGNCVTPVDYKKGRKPEIPEGAYEPERVQVCAQGLVLRECGFQSDHGVVYFVESKERVEVPFTDALVQRTREAMRAFRELVGLAEPPPPLVDNPKCPRCSLVGICLPDEVNMLHPERHFGLDDVRRLFPARDDAIPLYVQKPGAQVGKKDDRLQVRERGELLDEMRLLDVSQVCVFGNAQVTTQVTRELCERGIPIAFLSSGGWFYGMTHGMTHKNVELRLHQYRAALDEAASLKLAHRIVQTKILNCRTLLRRNVPDLEPSVLKQLAMLAGRAGRTRSAEELLGVEGAAGHAYWAVFPRMVRPPAGEALDFDMRGRNRRPPRDPVNALLSFAYSLLAKDFTLTLQAVGFDPYLGFYHRPRYGRPALALDLMEEFRPLVADSAVIGAINTGVVRAGDFINRGGAVALKQEGRARFIDAYERRMDQLVTHPVFGYRISYRRTLEVQARLLGRFLAGEIERYPMFRTR
jgi:CRISPR-associated endonuclease Cas1/CRISPR-associated protein Cas4